MPCSNCVRCVHSQWQLCSPRSRSLRGGACRIFGEADDLSARFPPSRCSERNRHLGRRWRRGVDSGRRLSIGTTVPINPPLLVIDGLGVEPGKPRPAARRAGTNNALSFNGPRARWASTRAPTITGLAGATPQLAAGVPLAVVGVGGFQKFNCCGGLDHDHRRGQPVPARHGHRDGRPARRHRARSWPPASTTATGPASPASSS